MELKAKLGSALTRAIFGGDVLPDGFFIEQPQPQQEVSVWVHGHGPPRNVTRCNGPASSVPCTLWVAFDAGQRPNEKQRDRLSLEFQESAGQQDLLGRIDLEWRQTIPAGQSDILVFEPRSASNYCHPIPHRYFHLLRQNWNTRQSKSKVKLSVLQQRAMSVIFTCPRPISLVSVAHEGRENMYPLNVMGDVNDQYFAFALTACKIPAQFLQVARRFALSVTPIEQAPTAFALAVNHNTHSMDFKNLPFPTRPSQTLGFAVPVFSPRVREMEIESVHTVGSHSLFVARTISDERLGNGTQLAVTHGFYQAWRLRHGLDDISSIAKDARIKAGKLSSALS